MSTVIPGSLKHPATRLIEVLQNECGFDLHDVGAALSLALAQVCPIAMANGIMTEEAIDELMLALAEAAMNSTVGIIVVANDD
jgi:hypothetical protein